MEIPITKAAQEIGVSERWLRMWCAGSGKCSPAMPHKSDARGRRLVDPAVAYEHIRKHCSRAPENLKPPVGHISGSVADTSMTVDFAGLDLPTDPRAFLESVFQRPELLQKMSSEQLKTLKSIAAELRLGDSALARQEQRLDPKDVIKMLRSFVELFVAVMEDQVASDAVDLLRTVRHEFGVALVDSNSAAREILEAHLRARANVVIEQTQRHLFEKCEALQLLEAISR